MTTISRIFVITFAFSKFIHNSYAAKRSSLCEEYCEQQKKRMKRRHSVVTFLAHFLIQFQILNQFFSSLILIPVCLVSSNISLL